MASQKRACLCPLGALDPVRGERAGAVTALGRFDLPSLQQALGEVALWVGALGSDTPPSTAKPAPVLGLGFCKTIAVRHLQRGVQTAPPEPIRKNLFCPVRGPPCSLFTVLDVLYILLHCARSGLDAGDVLLVLRDADRTHCLASAAAALGLLSWPVGEGALLGHGGWSAWDVDRVRDSLGKLFQRAGMPEWCVCDTKQLPGEWLALLCAAVWLLEAHGLTFIRIAGHAEEWWQATCEAHHQASDRRLAVRLLDLDSAVQASEFSMLAAWHGRADSSSPFERAALDRTLRVLASLKIAALGILILPWPEATLADALQQDWAAEPLLSLLADVALGINGRHLCRSRALGLTPRTVWLLPDKRAVLADSAGPVADPLYNGFRGGQPGESVHPGTESGDWLLFAKLCIVVCTAGPEALVVEGITQADAAELRSLLVGPLTAGKATAALVPVWGKQPAHLRHTDDPRVQELVRWAAATVASATDLVETTLKGLDDAGRVAALAGLRISVEGLDDGNYFVPPGLGGFFDAAIRDGG